jgi:hypothetical protein
VRKAYRRGCDVARRLRTILNFPSSDEQRRPVFTTSSRSIWELYLSPSIIVLNTALHLARRPPPRTDTLALHKTSTVPVWRSAFSLEKAFSKAKSCSVAIPR